MLNTESIYIAYLLTGLLGGFGHCTGMCGPIVFGYTRLLCEPPQGGNQKGSRYRYSLKGLLIHIYYNLGRTTTYVFLGGLLGGGFSALNYFKIEPLQRTLMIITGAMMIIAGLITGGFIRFRKFNLDPLNDRIIGLLSRLMKERSEGIIFPFGIIMGFLPCGLLYTVLIGVSTVSLNEKNTVVAVIKGMTLMGIFGLSTSISLILTGLISKTLFLKARAWLFRLSALIVVLLGVLFIWRAL